MKINKKWFKGLLILPLLYCNVVTAAELEIDLDALQQMLQDNPNDNNLRSTLIRRYIEEGNFDAAEKLVPTGDITGPEASILADLITKIKQVENGESLVENYDLNSPFDSGETTIQLNGIYRENIEDFTKILTYLDFFEHPISREIKIFYAEQLADMNQFSEVIRVLGRDTVFNVNEVLALQLRANACFQLELASCLNRDLSLLWKAQPTLLTGTRLVDSLIDQQQFLEASMVVIELETLWPNDTEVQRQVARISEIQLQQEGELVDNYLAQPSAERVIALSNYLFQTSDQERAFVLLESHLAMQGKNDAVQRQLGTQLHFNGYYYQAIDHLDDLEYPTEDDRVILGKSFAWNGQEDEAVLLFELLRKNSDALLIQQQSDMMLGYLNLWRGENERAGEYFQRVQQSGPVGIDQVDLQEAVYRVQDDHPALIASLQRRKQQQPYNTRIQLELAQAFVQAGQTNLAIEAFQKYLEITNDINGYLHLGQLYISEGKIDQGLIYLERYAYQVYNADALLMLAQNYHWVLREGDASRVLEALLQEYPDNNAALDLKQQLTSNVNIEIKSEESLNKLSEADQLYSAGAHREVRNLYQVLLQEFPLEHEMRERYAFTLEMLREHTLAAGEYYWLSQIYPNNNDVRMHYAFNLGRSGNFEGARDIFRQLLSTIVPSRPATPPLLSWLENWRSAWQSQNIASYQEYYSESFRQDETWLNLKADVFASIQELDISVSDPVFREISSEVDLENRPGERVYDLVFFQDYRTSENSETGYKTLRLHCLDDNCLIQDEIFSLERSTSQQEVYQAIQQRELINTEMERLSLSSAPSSSERSINGILLPAGVVKTMETESEVLASGIVQPVRLAGLSDAFVRGFSSEPVGPQKMRTSLRGKYFSDSNDISFSQIQVGHYIPRKLQAKTVLQADIGHYQFSSPQCGDYSNNTLELASELGGVRLGMNVDQLDSNTVVAPYISKTFRNNINLSVSSRAIFFDKISCGTLQNQTREINLAYSHYLPLKGNKSIWYAADVGVIDDGNRDFTAQFDYRMGLYQGAKFNYEWFATGWYLWNQTPMVEYYSPEFTDATMMNATIGTQISEKLSIVARVGAGYTFEDQQTLYNYGIRLDYKPIANISTGLDCQASNSSQSNYGFDYSSVSCQADFEFTW